jgi:hypothetical protein
MAYPTRYARRKATTPRHPALIFTGVHLDRDFPLPYQIRNNVYDFSQLVTVLYYAEAPGYKGVIGGGNEATIITPSRPEDKDSRTYFSAPRPQKRADRIIWRVPDTSAVLYRRIEDDLTDVARQYFTPEMKGLIAGGPPVKASILDSLVPYDETVTAFCDTLLALFERVCIAGLVEVEEVEGDFARVQKLLAYASRGGTVNEREMSLTRLEVIINRLKEKATA